MPIYEDDNHTREKLQELRRSNVCAVCKGRLDVFLDVGRGPVRAFLACRSDRSHEGIERIYEPTPFEEEGYGAYNLPARREKMNQEYGEKSTELTRFVGVNTLTKEDAMMVLKTIWPKAPEIEVIKAALICHQYGLNPLRKHLFLIPYKRRKDGVVVGVDWSTVIGIQANRLIAHRAGDFSYLDDTPRVMTKEEQTRIFGFVDEGKISAITMLRDSRGNTAPGYGSWPLAKVPHGAEEGNSGLNMAFIRSERNAMDRLFAGEMPQGVEVIDQDYAPSGSDPGEEIGETAEPAQELPTEEGGGTGEAISSTRERESKNREEAAAGEGFTIDPTWLKESFKSLNWSNETAKSFIASQYKVDGKGALAEVLSRLTREQAEEFTEEIKSRLDRQPGLFE